MKVTLPFHNPQGKGSRMAPDLSAIRARLASAYLFDRTDADALERAMGDVKALLAEVERLEEEAHTLRVWTEEAARAENLNAEDAKRERAAVVAWLRVEDYPCCRTCNAQIADAIERGDHRRKED